MIIPFSRSSYENFLHFFLVLSSYSDNFLNWAFVYDLSSSSSTDPLQTQPRRGEKEKVVANLHSEAETGKVLLQTSLLQRFLDNERFSGHEDPRERERKGS